MTCALRQKMRNGALLATILLNGCASPARHPAPKAPTGVEQSESVAAAAAGSRAPIALATCPNLPAANKRPLGNTTLPVSPTDVFNDEAQLVRPPSQDDPADWKVAWHQVLRLAAHEIDIWSIEDIGDSAGLVFVGQVDGARRVLATYATYAGGNGGHMSTVGTWTRPDCPMAIILVEEQIELRGYYEAPGNEASRVDAETERRWIALGVAADRVWLASEILRLPSGLSAKDDWIALLVRRKDEQLILHLQRDTLHFEALGK